MVPQLTLDPLDWQRGRLPRDHQDPTAPAHCLHIGGRVGFHCRGDSVGEECECECVVAGSYYADIRLKGSLNKTFMLTMIYRGQVDGFRSDRTQSGRHFQPQLVAVHPQRLDGAGFLTGLQAIGSHLSHFLSRSFPLLHHVTR